MEKLYYKLPYIKEFDAVVQICEPGKKERYEVVLDRTGFYPEGGGQPSDQGILGGVRVLEVHEKGGRIVHETDGPLEPGAAVRGCIQWESRYRNMQQHTGEHILSGIIHSRFGYDNVGFHMGSEAVTVDFNGILTPEELEEAEEAANHIIYANVPVATRYPSEDELETLDYRSKKELTGQVRIIEISGADVCACCGTHVERTGEVGIIKCTGMIHYKGGVRISMQCGIDALFDYRGKQNQVIRISNLLSSREGMIAEAVEKLKEELAARDSQIGELNGRLLKLMADRYEESAEPLVVFEEQFTPAMIRQYCTLLYEQGKGRIVLVCSGSGSTWQYAMGSSTEDMRAAGKLLNARLSGRGGGSALMVQGTFRADRKAIVRAIEEL